MKNELKKLPFKMKYSIRKVCIKCCIETANKTFGEHHYCNDCYDLLDLGNFKREIIPMESFLLDSEIEESELDLVI